MSVSASRETCRARNSEIGRSKPSDRGHRSGAEPHQRPPSVAGVYNRAAAILRRGKAMIASGRVCRALMSDTEEPSSGSRRENNGRVELKNGWSADVQHFIVFTIVWTGRPGGYAEFICATPQFLPSPAGK
jgi:hypothetical protein